LRSQHAISKKGRGGRKHAYTAFTEHGVITASNVLNSKTAIDMIVHVLKAFVRARRYLQEHKGLARELKELKATIAAKFSKYNEQFRLVSEVIDRTIGPLEYRKIGFFSNDH